MIRENNSKFLHDCHQRDSEKLTEAQKMAGVSSIDAQIEDIKGRLPELYERRKRQLIIAIEFEGLSREEIQKRLDVIKRDQAQDEKRLGELTALRANIERLNIAKVQFDELYDGILQGIERSSEADKGKALRMLNIKIYAQKGEPARIDGVIPIALPTIEQTSASRHMYSSRRRQAL